jgi:DNA-binding transcriptional ArsR family regulator
VSEHLKVLRKAGLLDLDREGRFWFYRANERILEAIIDELARMTERTT